MSKVIKLGNYKGIQATVHIRPVTQSEIDREVQLFLDERATLKSKLGPVVEGDLTTIDFEGFKDGVPFEGGKAEGFQLEIGSGQFIPGFEEQMIGMERGETRDLHLTFPANYPAPELAGAPVIFKVKLHAIQTKEQPVLDDAFIMSLGAPEIKNVDDFLAAVKASLEAKHADEQQTEKENAVLGALIDSSEVEISEEDTARAIEQHITHIEMQLASQQMTLEQYLTIMGMDETSLRQQIIPVAKQQAKFEAIIDEVIRVEGLETSDDEVDTQIDLLAQNNQISREYVLGKIDPADLKRDFTRVKASQLILNHAQFTEVENDA